jgi:hypothetical protein
MATPDRPDCAQTRGSRPSSSTPPLTTERIHMPNRSRRLGRLPEYTKQLPDTDLTRMAELIESCRAHAASVAELAGVTSQALDQCYEYEENDPHLGRCCELVRHVLEQTESALVILGVTSDDVEPRVHEEEVAKGCELERQTLTCAMHVVRATSAIVGTSKSNGHDHVLLALHDLESGLQFLVDSLRRVAKQ